MRILVLEPSSHESSIFAFDGDFLFIDDPWRPEHPD